ncbi:hypothetical protein [Polyangium sp. 15x6]|uniref:hypothetical protein n=1 Tax=Polyangium sp. 15x6 TaxID=3042687 RepID=UPI00249BD2EE|nr:hypothetical protein [Polyangium sp. 15x6]MDI3284404.1 hypothetical protein [Polyangium sp. 15x6]
MFVRVGMVALSLVLGTGCRDESVSPTKAPETAPSASPPASAVPTPSRAESAAPSPAAPSLPALPARKVPSKTLADGSLLGEFSFERAAGDEGMAWLAAEDACVAAGKHLCTATQWQAACEADPAVSAVETWTLTPERDAGFLVRGGGAGCGRKTVAPGAQASPFRAGACCTPALAAAGRDIQPAMLRAMAKNVLDLERTLNARRASALTGFFDERVRVFLKEKSRAEAVAVFEHEFGKYEDYAAVHELCDFSAAADNETYTADCRKITRFGGKVGHVLTRYVFVAGSGKLRSITDPAMYRAFAEP